MTNTKSINSKKLQNLKTHNNKYKSKYNFRNKMNFLLTFLCNKMQHIDW